MAQSKWLRDRTSLSVTDVGGRLYAGEHEIARAIRHPTGVNWWEDSQNFGEIGASLAAPWTELFPGAVNLSSSFEVIDGNDTSRHAQLWDDGDLEELSGWRFKFLRIQVSLDSGSWRLRNNSNKPAAFVGGSVGVGASVFACVLSVSGDPLISYCSSGPGVIIPSEVDIAWKWYRGYREGIEFGRRDFLEIEANTPSSVEICIALPWHGFANAPLSVPYWSAENGASGSEVY